MLSIITPCSRQHNIPTVYNSIIFSKINKWIIVYDTSNDRKYEKIYDDPQIIEIECNEGLTGNPQRNLGITLVEDDFIYFLDDDNIIHPNFWSIVDELNTEKFYTFDQLRHNNILYGNNIKPGQIDTAMFIVHKKHTKDIYWINNSFEADGHFIHDVLNKNISSHIYLNIIGAYYNFLRI